MLEGRGREGKQSGLELPHTSSGTKTCLLFAEFSSSALGSKALETETFLVEEESPLDLIVNRWFGVNGFKESGSFKLSTANGRLSMILRRGRS